MTLFIQRDTGSAGTGSVFPDRAGVDLITISNMDTGYGEVDPAPGHPQLIQVTYARTTTGPCPQRLDTLVNTDFPGTAGNVDILVIGSDENFTLNNGTIVGPGATLRPNFTVGAVNLNPSSSAVVIYDTTDNAGAGICVQREGGGAMDVPSPSSVILYHELSHALRICTSSPLSTTETVCTSASPEESAAITDENDMRDQLGVAHRQPGNHCANVGCASGPCCIVASVASGSPFSADVGRLRQIRDGFLRRSEVGYDFFERLHTDYYRFSPQVVDAMGGNPGLRGMVAALLVRPLVEALTLVHEYTVGGAAPEELGRRLDERVGGWPELAALGPGALETLRGVVSGTLAEDAAVPLPGLSADGEIQAVAALLRERALSSPYVRWGIADVLALFLDALRARAAGAAPDEVGRGLAAAIDEWAAAMPITDVWPTLSRHELSTELAFLRRSLLRSPGARRAFARRLAGAFRTGRVPDVLQGEWNPDQEVAP